jgi:hypothetical protein
MQVNQSGQSSASSSLSSDALQQPEIVESDHEPPWLKPVKIINDLGDQLGIPGVAQAMADGAITGTEEALRDGQSPTYKTINAVAETAMSQLFDAALKDSPVGAADTILNTLEDTDLLPHASDLSPKKFLTSSIQATSTLAEGWFNGDAGVLQDYQTEALKDPYNPFYWLTKGGQTFANSQVGQDASDYWAQNGFLGGLKTAGQAAESVFETGTNAAATILFPQGAPQPGLGGFGGAVP